MKGAALRRDLLIDTQARRDRRAAAGRRLAATHRTHPWSAEGRKARDEIADYLAREPKPRFYG